MAEGRGIERIDVDRLRAEIDALKRIEIENNEATKSILQRVHEISFLIEALRELFEEPWSEC
jgi:hypothetical protein